MAIAVEHVNLHKRIALNTMRVVGTSPRMLILSFMLPAAFLSMWISNTAATAMMIPIMEAVLEELELIGSTKKVRPLLAMSVAMAANIGGTGTIIGTGPNLLVLGVLDENFEDHPLTFGSWMAFAIPIEITSLLILWLWLQVYYLPWPKLGKNQQKKEQEEKSTESIREMIYQKCRELGPIKFNEKVVLTLFSILILLWLLRHPGFFTGYGDVIGMDLEDASVAIFVCIFLFLMPSEPTFLKFEPCATPLIDWKTMEKKLPWGVLLLLGGGMALAEGSKRSGLNDWIGGQLSAATQDVSNFVTVLIVCLIASALTQVASNTASASIVLPIIKDLGISSQVNPMLFMLPAALSCSFSFMLPVSTPPNAIVFESSGLRVVDFMKVGTIMNVLCIGLVVAATYSYGTVLFDLEEFPDWARNTTISNRYL